MRRFALIAVSLLISIVSLIATASANWTVTLGPSDGFAVSQPQVAVGVYTLDGATALGPENYNTFVLDTGSTTILAGADASGELASHSQFQTVATYYESGIGGFTPTEISDNYQFAYAGNNGVPTILSPTRILVSNDDVGFDGVAGMPLMLHHSTTLDLSVMASFSDVAVAFSPAPPAPTGTAVGHRYNVPLKLVNFPLDGQVNPTDPPPAFAPLAKAAVQVRQGSHVVESHFLVDTGAQTSFISSSLAAALGINPDTDAVGTIPVQGVAGTVEIPVVDVASLGLHTTQGKDLVWTNLEVGVLDIDPSIQGIFGMDFLTSGWLNAVFGGSGTGFLSKVHFDFRNSDNMTGEMLLDVYPGHDVTNTSDHSASWDFTAGGSFNQATNWYSPAVPNGAGVLATFGDGILNTVTGPTVSVNIDGAQVLGQIAFNSTQGLGYILASDGIAGHGITLDNNGAGATVSVASGVTALQQIQANLVLADNTTFNIASGSSLSISVGGISETGGSRGISLTGGGTLTLAAPSSFTGGTTISGGTLTTTGAGTLGPGFLAVNGSGTAASIVNLGGNQTVSSLSGSLAGGGTARVNVPAGKILTVNQPTSTYFEGNVVLAAGAAPAGGGKLVKSDAGTLELDGALSLGENSTVNVSGGVLRLSTTSDSSGSVAVGTGVTANVSSLATLELAGSISSLSAGANRVHIVNSSTSAAGLLVSGANQVTGAIDGGGKTQVVDGGSLTADHIIQGALVIGGTASNHSAVTLAASDSHGNPLDGGGALAIAGSLDEGGPYPSGTVITGAAPAAIGADGGSLAVVLASAGSLAVPEPSSIMLLLLGGAVWLIAAGKIARK